MQAHCDRPPLHVEQLRAALDAKHGFVDRLIGGEELAMQVFDESISAFYRRMKRTDFPAPVERGPRRTRWRLSDIQAYIANLGRVQTS